MTWDSIFGFAGAEEAGDIGTGAWRVGAARRGGSYSRARTDSPDRLKLQMRIHGYSEITYRVAGRRII